jgi:NADPH-dependent 2,4-dienoyl-CoA reductase/sulfur reductase-like enzyme
VPEARVALCDAASQRLVAETDDGCREIAWDALILATGARERFLPFPGWTLPGVTGVGGLQALAKGGLPLRRKRVAVAGSGPLLLAAAAFFRKEGAEVILIAEQASPRSLALFARSLLKQPAKLLQAAALQGALLGVPYRLNCRPVATEGRERLEQITFQIGSRTFSEDIDYAAIAWGLVPNTELAQMLGCRVTGNGVAVDDLQRTSVRSIYCAGEATGIGGVELSEIEGAIAGCSAAGDDDAARRLIPRLAGARAFAAALETAFTLSPELRALPSTDTIVCRCEDVPFKALQSSRSLREAKLHTRCGMGPCQGRICGPACEFLFGWQPESIRPPASPARIETLICSSAPKGDIRNARTQGV